MAAPQTPETPAVEDPRDIELRELRGTLASRDSTIERLAVGVSTPADPRPAIAAQQSLAPLGPQPDADVQPREAMAWMTETNRRSQLASEQRLNTAIDGVRAEAGQTQLWIEYQAEHPEHVGKLRLASLASEEIAADPTRKHLLRDPVAYKAEVHTILSRELASAPAATVDAGKPGDPGYVAPASGVPTTVIPTTAPTPAPSVSGGGAPLPPTTTPATPPTRQKDLVDTIHELQSKRGYY